MSHVSACPYCQGPLYRSRDPIHGDAEMFRCRECRRWFLHRHEGARCGLRGWMTAHPTREKFLECKQQQELFQ